MSQVFKKQMLKLKIIAYHPSLGSVDLIQGNKTDVYLCLKRKIKTRNAAEMTYSIQSIACCAELRTGTSCHQRGAIVPLPLTPTETAQLPANSQNTFYHCIETRSFLSARPKLPSSASSQLNPVVNFVKIPTVTCRPHPHLRLLLWCPTRIADAIKKAWRVE